MTCSFWSEVGVMVVEVTTAASEKTRGWKRVGNVCPRSCRKRARKHDVKPQTLESNQREGGRAGHLQELPTTSTSSQAGVAVTVGSWCFCFESSPVPGQSPSVTHTNWLLADFGHFSSETFFFPFSEFPLVFSRYSTWMK